MKAGRSLWFVSLVLCYVVQVWIFRESTGFGHFLSVDWRVFQRLSLVAIPAYVYVFWRRREELFWSDYAAPYLALGAWLLGFWVCGAEKGLMNALVVEPNVVAILSGLYLLRFVRWRGSLEAGERNVAYAMLAVVAACGFGTACIVPALGE